MTQDHRDLYGPDPPILSAFALVGALIVIGVLCASADGPTAPPSHWQRHGDAGWCIGRVDHRGAHCGRVEQA